MNNRIKELRKHLGMTQQEFAESLCIKRGAIANYEIGRNIPTGSVLSLICKNFNVNEEWLKNGTGKMFIEVDEQDRIADFATELFQEKDDSFKRRFILAFSDLTDEEWKLLEKLHDRINFETKKED